MRRTEQPGTWRLNADQIPKLLAAYEEHGFGYQPYRDTTNYGFSLASPWWVARAIESTPDLRLVGHTEMGWVMFQDTVSCIKRRIDGVITAGGREQGWVADE